MAGRKFRDERRGRTLESVAAIGYKADRIGAWRSALQGNGMDKQAMREEAERLIRETMERKALVVKQGDTRIMAVCGKCGAANKVSAPKGVARVSYVCKECGHKQVTL
jgi:3-deoxy-D-arabino-heptulosonate 7-phosphate (DAHP) synthase